MLSFHVSGSPGFVFLNPLSLAADDCGSVLAVKGSLRRFAPWTAAGRSGRRGCLRGKGDGSRRPPAQISECARLIRASSSIAGTGLMSVSPPATTRVYCGASPYCLGKASRAPIWFLTRSPGGYPAMSKMTLLRPSSTSASCTNERFRNDPTANWFSRAWGLRNAIAGEIQLAIVFCNAVREAVIQALRREGTPHHHHPAPDGKHN